MSQNNNLTEAKPCNKISFWVNFVLVFGLGLFLPDSTFLGPLITKYASATVTLDGGNNLILIFFFFSLKWQTGIVTWMSKQEKSEWVWMLFDQNQSPFKCGNKSDMIQIQQIFPGTASWVSLKIPAVCTQAFIKAHFFLLHLQVHVVSFCSTLFKSYRMYGEHTQAVLHNLSLFNFCNQSPLSSSHHAWLVFHSNLSLEQSERSTTIPHE